MLLPALEAVMRRIVVDPVSKATETGTTRMEDGLVYMRTGHENMDSVSLSVKVAFHFALMGCIGDIRKGLE